MIDVVNMRTGRNRMMPKRRIEDFLIDIESDLALDPSDDIERAMRVTLRIVLGLNPDEDLKYFEAIYKEKKTMHESLIKEEKQNGN